MTAEHDGADPSESALAHFGREARLEREKLGWSHARFGTEAHCGYSQVAKVERGERVPSQVYAETCDRVFPGADGRFMRLWPLALRFAYPPGFRKYIELEDKAARIHIFNSVLMPGLLQTEDYARAILRKGRTADLEDLVAARMARKRILAQATPPPVWIVLDEAVLRRAPGNDAILHDQLARLRDFAETPPHTLQIVPDDRSHFLTPFGILSFDDGADIAHVDGYPTGYLVADSVLVSDTWRVYDQLRAAALPPENSASVIDRIIKERS